MRDVRRCQHGALPRQTIDRRRLNVGRAVESNVCVPEVIAHDHHDVGTLARILVGHTSTGRHEKANAYEKRATEMG